MTDCRSAPGLMPLEQGLEKLRQELHLSLKWNR